MKIGTTQTERSVSSHERISIATGVREDDDNVRDDARDRARDDRLDAAYVIREPRLDLARARGREEAERHALEVRVELVSEVLHDPLADHGGQVGLGDRDSAADHREEADHEAHSERVEQAELRLASVGREERVVEDDDEERVGDPDRRGDEDRRDDDPDPGPVGP